MFVFETRKELDAFVKSISESDPDGVDIIFYQMANGQWHLEIDPLHLCSGEDCRIATNKEVNEEK